MQKQEFVMPSTPADRAKIRSSVIEASNAMLQVESLREHLTGIKNDIKEELGMPPKLFNKLVKTYHKQTYGKEVQEAEEFQDTYETIFPPSDSV